MKTIWHHSKKPHKFSLCISSKLEGGSSTTNKQTLLLQPDLFIALLALRVFSDLVQSNALKHS